MDYALDNLILQAPRTDYNKPASRAVFASVLAAALPADALSALFDLARDVNATFAAQAPSQELCSFALSLFDELAGVLGLVYRTEDESLGSDESAEIEALIAQRTEARKNRDWATADRIRDELKARHVVLEDTPQGVKWHIES